MKYPKNIQENIVTFAECPSCGNRVVEYEDCKNCGQELLWELEETYIGDIPARLKFKEHD